MKLKHTLIASALALVLAAGLRAQTATATTAAAPADTAPADVATTGTAAPAPQFTDAQVFEMLGWYIVSNTPINELDADAPLKDAFIKGARAAVDGKPSPYDNDKIRPDMERVLGARQEAYQARQKTDADKKAAAFFADLKKNTNIQTLPTGVMYEILRPGAGAFPTANDTVTINYLGTLSDGTKFDSSYDRGEPAVFPLSGVIPGMTDALQKINKGGKIKIYIPYDQGYGDRGSPQIPPFSILIFEVELLDFGATPPPPADTADATADAADAAAASAAAKADVAHADAAAADAAAKAAAAEATAADAAADGQ